MTWFLDTNTCIYFLKGSFLSIKAHIAAHRAADIAIPAMVKAELLYGAEKSDRRDATLDAIHRFADPYCIIPFDEAASGVYAGIRAVLERRGMPIGPNDLIIAATVLSHGGTLVTRNTREFRRVAGLTVEDWTQ